MRIRTVQIGITDACNLSCIMCTHDRLFEPRDDRPCRNPGFMSMEMFRKIIGDLTEPGNSIDLIFLAWIGESLLHKDFIPMAEHAAAINEKKKFFKTLAVNTNATCITKEFSDDFVRLTRSYPKTKFHIAFSLDAWSEETHRKIKKRGNAEVLKKEIQYFLEVNKKSGNASFHLTFLVLEENLDEAVDFVSGWKEFLTSLDYDFKVTHDDIVDDNTDNLIILKRAILPDQIRSDSLHKKAAVNSGLIIPGESEKIFKADSISKKFVDEYIFKDQSRRSPCPALWQYPTIHWDGRVTLCCKDNELDLTVGDLNENSFQEVWNTGETITRYRQWMLEGKFHLLPECAHCGNYDVESMTEQDLATALDETNQSDLLEVLSSRLESGTDSGIQERMEEFFINRPDRIPEFKKAAQRFLEMEMTDLSRISQDYFHRGFPRYINLLIKKGEIIIARNSMEREFEKIFNDSFENSICQFQASPQPEILIKTISEYPSEIIELVNTIAPELSPETTAQNIQKHMTAKFSILRDIGNSYWQIQDYTSALKYYRNHLETSPHDLSVLKQIAFSSYHLKDLPAAEQTALRVLEIYQDFEMNRLLGHIFLETSRFQSAAKYFHQAMELDTEDFLSKQGLLRARVLNGETDIKDLFLHLIEISPDEKSRSNLRDLLKNHNIEFF
jgi:MoaA/NifB/PqqE/SkfB family radical SAM enzyme